LLALKVARSQAIDDGKRVELETGGTFESPANRLHVVGADDFVAVVI
jgi:hypothetical protein